MDCHVWFDDMGGGDLFNSTGQLYIYEPSRVYILRATAQFDKGEPSGC